MKLEIEEELKQRNKELLILNTVISFLNQFINIGELLESALEKVLEIMTIESGALLLMDATKRNFILEVSKGFSPDFVSKISVVSADQSTLGQTICSGNHLLIGEGDTGRIPAGEWLQDENLNTLFCLPIKTKKKVYGMIMCGHRYSRFFSARTMSLLETIGYQIALVLENALLYKEVKDSEERYQGLFQSVDVGIVSFSKEGHVVQCNAKAEELLCLPEGDAVHSACKELLFDKHQQLIEDLAHSYALSGNTTLFSQHVIVYGRDKDGKEQPLELSLSVWGARRSPTITATMMKMR